jgi:simple sugar transport system ATP-binding protein
MINKTPREFIDQGIGHIPEDRLGMGLVLDFSVADNFILETHDKDPFTYQWLMPFKNKLFLNQTEIGKYANELISEYDIVTPSKDVPTKTLSGGNLQKLILARELSRNPKLLIANQPTRGLDVGATEFLHRKLMEQKKNGMAILLISDDLDEILSTSDRVGVMYEGEMVSIVPVEKASIKDFALLMAGVKLVNKEK